MTDSESEFTSTCIALGKLLDHYDALHERLETTPDWIPSKPHEWGRALHAALGLCGEAVEILDLFKKELFGKQVPVPAEALKLELGDLFWYFWLMIDAMGWTFEEVLEANMAKLSSRYGVGK